MLRGALLIAGKDIRLLFGRGGSISQALLLGLLLFFIFSLSLPPGEHMNEQAAAAIFWLATVFCQVLVHTALFSLEETGNTRQGLLLAPIPDQAIWCGKALAGLLTVGCAQCIFLFALVVFLDQSFGPAWPLGLVSILLADIGIAAVGALLGALAQGQAGRESLLSIVCFPLLIPPLLAAIRIGAFALSPGAHTGEPGGWIGVLAAFDAVFIGAGLILFPFVYGDE